MIHRSLALLTFALSLSPAAQAEELKIANWNIQTLVYAGDTHTVFEDDYVRTASDFADLRAWREKVGAPVFLLQEVSSPAAINEVFPVADGWQHCISGQFADDEKMMPPGPICTNAGDKPVKPVGTTRAQYTAVAWKTAAGVTLQSIADYADLNVQSDDGGAGVRDVRWGLDAKFQSHGKTVRALVVHLKSGCFDDLINFRLFTVDPKTTPPTRNACDTVGRQMFPLRAWVAARESSNEAWMIVGDFNRRLDSGAGRFQDEVWQAISGYSPGADMRDRDNRADIELFRAPYKKPSLCWAETLDPYPDSLPEADNYNLLPIEFFVFGSKAQTLVVPGAERQIPWTAPDAADRVRLSDHCPSVLSLDL